MKSYFFSSIIAFVLAAGLRGSSVAQVQLPDTPQGRMVREYIEVFNGGTDDAVRKFFSVHVSKKGLAERSVESRLEGMKKFRDEVKSLTLQQMLKTEMTSLSVTARTGSAEMLTLGFIFDPAPPYGFAGLRVEMGEQEPAGGPPMSRKEFLSTVERYLDEAVRADRFSGAVLVARDTSVLFKRAYGEADKRFNVPNRIDTKFNIGSINKYFTRLAIARLAETGKLSLDKPVITYLPDYPNKAVAENVTIDHLLTMRSGMGDFFGKKFDDTPKTRIRTLNDYLRLFVDDPLLFDPGTQRQYSNAGHIVLGLIIERLTGRDYYEYMRERIFEPAGMMNTDWFPSDAVTPNLATGYTHPDDDEHTWIGNVHSLPGRGSSAGGGYTTLDDMRRFVVALVNGKLLSPRYTEWMVMRLLPTADPPIPLRQGGIGIAGGTLGVNAIVEFDAESGHLVIVLANYDPPSAEEVSRKINDLMKRVDWTNRW